MCNDVNVVSDVYVVGRSCHYSVTDVICSTGKVFREMWKNIHTDINEKCNLVIFGHAVASSDIHQRDTVNEEFKGNLFIFPKSKWNVECVYIL